MDERNKMSKQPIHHDHGPGNVAIAAAGLLRRHFGKIASARRDLVAMTRDPQIAVDLMYRDTRGNDPFYRALVLDFYRSAHRRHPKLLLFRRLSHGVALATLPRTFNEYFMKIEAAARRNVKKAQRLGYDFSRIAYNEYLEDISAILQSTECRQGRMSQELLEAPLKPSRNPVSQTSVHDFAHFGILRKGTVCAYAGCFIAGEICLIERIFGHAALQGDGIVPMLIVSIAEHLYERHPNVKYYGYGTYYGAREEMRRFKRKFLFTPHRVLWNVG
jgi:hypothetical protein